MSNSVDSKPVTPHPRRPFWLLAEGPRAVFEMTTLPAVLPALSTAPRGDGHPVLVIPGFGGGDMSTRPMRKFLANRGYWAHRWALGRNKGLPDGTTGRLMDRLAEIHRRHERKVSIVGWSIGGIYARELAKQAPEIVRQVICLGSPFGGEARGHSVDQMYRAVVGEQPTAQQRAAFDNLQSPPPVPSTAIYSKTDGIVYWKACQEPEAPQTDNIEVPGSHIGLVVNPIVLWATADRLAQPENGWRPFDRSGLRRFLYR